MKQRYIDVENGAARGNVDTRWRLKVDTLAEAIHCAVFDSAMRQKATDLGARIRAENGIAQAVAAVEQKWGHPQ